MPSCHHRPPPGWRPTGIACLGKRRGRECRPRNGSMSAGHSQVTRDKFAERLRDCGSEWLGVE